MGSDRITILRGRSHGALDWYVYRRGQPEVQQQGHLADAGDSLPPDLRGNRASAITLVLPTSQIVIRVMKFPLLDADELAGAVALQVDKFSPFPVEQMVYSYEVLAQDPEEVTVLIAISQLSSVTSWGDALRKMGARIARVDCMALGLWASLRASEVLGLDRRESLLFVDSDEVVLLTHDGGQLLAISGLGPSGALTDAGGCDDLAEEVARILMETDAENGVGATAHLVLAAFDEATPLSGLQAALAEALDVPVDSMQGRVFPDVATGVMQRIDVAANAFTPLNLIPAAWVQAAESQRSQRRLITVGCGLLGLWLLLLGGGWGYMAWQHARLTYLEEAEQQWLIPANAVRGLRLQARLMDRYRDRSHSALESLREMSTIQPQGVDLISFTYRKGDGIEVVGEADSGELVLQFNQRLNESELFADVRPGTRTRTRQGRHRFSFDISFGEETL